MTLFRKSPHSWRRAVWMAAFVAIFTTAWVAANRAQTQEETLPPVAFPPANAPYSLFQYSTLTGSGNTITATWLPVVNALGVTAYKNVTVQFNVDAYGNLTVAPGYPKVVAAPAPLVSSFVAGNYVGPSTVLGGNALITVSGPGITTGGATEWSLAASSGASACTYPNSATWYVGPMSSNPLLTRLTKAGITATQYSDYGGWGVTGAENGCGGASQYYGPDSLIALSQTNGALSIVSFTNYDGDDSSTPQLDIPYTLIPSQ